MNNAREYLEKTGLNEKVISGINKYARIHGMERVILFGSRARGDYRRASNIDLAVYGGNVSAFRLDIDEEVPTLLFFDVVDMNNSSSRELKDIVGKEGIVVYEKNDTV